MNPGDFKAKSHEVHVNTKLIPKILDNGSVIGNYLMVENVAYKMGVVQLYGNECREKVDAEKERIKEEVVKAEENAEQAEAPSIYK